MNAIPRLCSHEPVVFLPPLYFHHFAFGFLSLATQRVLSNTSGFRKLRKVAGRGYCGAEQNERNCYVTASCYAALAEDEACRLISRSYLTWRTQLPPRKTASQESAARTQLTIDVFSSVLL